jgi:transcriptional regulator with XRE-family HTH domain
MLSFQLPRVTLGAMPASVSDLCQQRGLTLEQLVARTGLDEQRLTAILLGRWTPSPSERQRVAAALDVTIEDISWGHTTPIQLLYGHGPG